MIEKVVRGLKRPSNLLGLSGVAAIGLGLADFAAERYFDFDILPGTSVGETKSDYVPSSLNFLRMAQDTVRVGEYATELVSGAPDAHFEPAPPIKSMSEWNARDWSASISSGAFLGALYSGILGKQITQLAPLSKPLSLVASVSLLTFSLQELQYLSASAHGLSLPDSLIWGGTSVYSSAAAYQRGQGVLRAYNKRT